MQPLNRKQIRCAPLRGQGVWGVCLESIQGVLRIDQGLGVYRLMSGCA